MDKHYEVGDVVDYYTTFGDDLRTVMITDKEPDVKNGRPGFDGVVISGPEAGLSVWGYDWQIVAVHTR